MELRNRNKGIRRVRVADIQDAEFNFRTHPQNQRETLADTVDELGWYGYPDVYEAEGGVLTLHDGHLRKSLLLEKYGTDTEIEVNVTDFDEAEAKKAVLTKDPLAALAEADKDKLDALLREVQTESQAISDMLTGLAELHGVVPVEPAAGAWPPINETTSHQFIVHYADEDEPALKQFIGVEAIPANQLGAMVLERIKELATP